MLKGKRRIIAVLFASAALVTAGLAAAHAAAGGGPSTSASTTTTMSTITDCTRDHPCPNPGCTEAGHGPLDCKDGTTASETTTTTVKTTGHPKILKNWVGGDPPSGGAPFTIVCQDQSKDVSQTTPGQVQEYETVACMLNQLWTAIEHVPVGWQCVIGGNVTAISGHPDECEVTQVLGAVGEPPAVFTNQKVTTTTTESTPTTTTPVSPPPPTTTSTPPPAATTTSSTPAATTTTTASVTTTSAPPATTTTTAPTPPTPPTPVTHKHHAPLPAKPHKAVVKVLPPRSSQPTDSK